MECHDNGSPIKIARSGLGRIHKGAPGNDIVLMGNPNVGKSVVFSRLTGARVISSNYPGTTVDVALGHMDYKGRRIHVVDAPGTYCLTASCKAEDVAVKMVNEAEIIINVLDATNLERNLFMTLELLELNKPTLVVLNMWDETRHLGIDIDIVKLEEKLGVPVVTTNALTGEGIKELVDSIGEARPSTQSIPPTEDGKWSFVGSIVRDVQQVKHKHHTIWDRLEDATIRPATGIPIAILIMLFAFMFVRLIGEGLIGFVFDPLFELYRPLVLSIADSLGPGLLRDTLIGEITNGDVDFVESLGVLTTGLYVPFAMVFPYILSFYFVLAIFEDSGYLPRLATLADNLFHRLGMHGHGIISVFLGVGCNVPGVLSTRMLPTRKQRLIASTLLSISVPCLAQSAMIFGVLGKFGVGYIILVFVSLAMVYIGTGLVLGRIIKGPSPELFLEIPPYRRPSIMVVLKKTGMRVRAFLFEAVPYLFIGVVIINFLYALGMVDLIGQIFSPIISGWLGLPGEATTALLIGFLRKDLAVGMLLSLGLNAGQLVVAVMVLSMSFPCVATFVVMVKELGVRDMVIAISLMIVLALLVGGFFNLMFMVV